MILCKAIEKSEICRIKFAKQRAGILKPRCAGMVDVRGIANLKPESSVPVCRDMMKGIGTYLTPDNFHHVLDIYLLQYFL